MNIHNLLQIYDDVDYLLSIFYWKYPVWHILPWKSLGAESRWLISYILRIYRYYSMSYYYMLSILYHPLSLFPPVYSISPTSLLFTNFQPYSKCNSRFFIFFPSIFVIPYLFFHVYTPNNPLMLSFIMFLFVITATITIETTTDMNINQQYTFTNYISNHLSYDQPMLTHIWPNLYMLPLFLINFHVCIIYPSYIIV